ncbi:2-oxo-4-hydroxy-4-carboxy-5-ureidoimidazoline decarboxylase [Polycladidibacter hongkongensis]|uniref:2-oxo-4-hydroxy-4-carboxy-5-ureidoimidazoline decarboxylase n=1 Tax=Polycladidibacter hongkongensis TaxID=1647556 RepID=UPI00083152E6|nr:2-oxo-4-hydroxy-4-carboxy-5-ureidoimidazoline decarboxylase [Pseudovibrio hongkongensis]
MEQVNQLSHQAFVARFGDVVEQSSWVADAAAHRRPFADVTAMHLAFEEVLNAADVAQQLDVICAHPDLAGRAALAGDVAAASEQEQQSAGLDKLRPKELREFTELNEAYRQRFGFPFIYAVRGAHKYDILDAFRRRLQNSSEAEQAEALRQISRIIAFRLEDALGNA